MKVFVIWYRVDFEIINGCGLSGRAASIFIGAPGGARFQRVKVPNLPGSGKDIANGKGVVGDNKSEGSRMANLWSDEQKSHIRLYVGVRLPNKSKPNNYTELHTVNVADRRRERNVWYPGRSVRYALKGVTTTKR